MCISGLRILSAHKISKLHIDQKSFQGLLRSCPIKANNIRLFLFNKHEQKISFQYILDTIQFTYELVSKSQFHYPRRDLRNIAELKKFEKLGVVILF